MEPINKAYDIFRNWRKSNTILRVTMLVEGEEPKVLVGQIIATDEDAGQVGFAIKESRALTAFDLNGASFNIGKHVLEAERGEDRLMFEEATAQQHNKPC